jgi:tetratricopeptide (TPR) repeat protein
MGACKYSLNQYKEALFYINRAIVLDPKEGYNYIIRGLLYYNTMKITSAEEDLKRAICLGAIRLETIQLLLKFELPFLTDRLFETYPKISELIALQPDIASQRSQAYPWKLLLAYLYDTQYTTNTKTYWQLKALIRAYLKSSFLTK